MAAIDWTRLPSLTSLRAFEAAVAGRSFSAAARSLNVTHAAVAQQVRALEEALSCKLLDRSPRGVQPTVEGRALAAQLREGFGIIADAVSEVAGRSAARPVRVTTPAYFADSVIFPRISEFWAENPGLEVAFTPSDAVIDIVAEGYDLAVRAGSGDYPGLRTTLLVQSPAVACAAARLVDDPETDWDALPWLLPADSWWERAALEKSGIDPGTIETIDLGDPSLEIRACEEGIGLILETELDLRRVLESGTLKIAPIPIRNLANYYTVLPPWPPRPAVARFEAWLRRLCDGL